MKKYITLLIVALTISTVSYAQKELMSLNEQNKYTYFKVGASIPEVNTEALAGYLKKNVPGIQTTETIKSTMVSGKGGLLVYKQGLITGQEEGRIDYQFSVDFKESKYRLIVTNFTFIPYQRNRYGVFAPVDNISIYLESSSGKISAKQLNSYLDKLGIYGKKMDKSLNDFLFSKAASTPNPAGLKKVDTKSW
jgi:hypothetical protein